MSDSLAIIVANPDSGAAVLDVLRDWSAMDLISDFLWVLASEPATQDSARALLICAGQGRLTTVAEHIADSPDLQTLRVCALDSLSGPAELEAAQRLLDQLAGGSGGTDIRLFGMSITRVHVVAMSLLAAQTRPIEVSGGWHSLILAAEDRYGPGEAAVKLQQGDRGMCAMHTAAGLAGLLGLWAGIPHSALDGATPPSQQLVRLARCYFRSIDADHITAELGDLVTDTASAAPRTCHDEEELPPPPDEARSLADAAEALLRLHPEVLRGNVAPPERPQVKVIGWWRMLKMFVGFLWAAMRNAPRDWANGVVAVANQGMANLVQRMVGVDSQYRVIANGRMADGRLASWQEIDRALDSVQDAAGVGDACTEPIALGPLWQDFFEVGLSLVDGATRNPGVPLPKYGTRDAVISRAADVAMPPSEVYRISPAVAAQLGNLGVPHIDPCDLRLCDLALREISRRPPTVKLASEEDSLRAWRDKVSHTYAGRVGEALSRELDALRAEIDQLMQRMHASSGAAPVSGDVQERLGGRMRATTLIGLLAILGLLAARAMGLISSGIAAIIALVGLVVWFTAMFVMFLRAQRDVFALVNRLEADVGDEKRMRARLGEALAEYSRISVAYRQYQDWARVLGAFLAAPLGGTSADVVPEPKFIRGRLPRSVQLGSVVADRETELVAARLRRHLYVVGWLSGPYEILMQRAADVANPARPPGRWQSHADVFHDINKPYTPCLRQFADEIWSCGLGPGAALGFRGRTLELLGADPFKEDLVRLIKHVRWAGNHNPPEAVLDAGDDFQFDPAPLRREHVEDDRRVVSSVPFDLGAVIGRKTSLAQFSGPFPASDLSFGGGNGQLVGEPAVVPSARPGYWKG